MDSVAHIEDDTKELARDIHKFVHLGVQLVDSTKNGLWFIIVPSHLLWQI